MFHISVATAHVFGKDQARKKVNRVIGTKSLESYKTHIGHQNCISSICSQSTITTQNEGSVALKKHLIFLNLYTKEQKVF